MLNFDCGVLDFRIKIFTNIEDIRMRFDRSNLRFVHNIEQSDICILDKHLEYDRRLLGNILMIRTYDGDEEGSVYFEEDVVEKFLILLERFESKEYGVGMASYRDVKEATKGRLVKYQKFEADTGTIEDKKKIFKESLEDIDHPSSMILYLSQSKLGTLFEFARILEDKFSEIAGVVMMPAKVNNDSKEYIELYLFKGLEAS